MINRMRITRLSAVLNGLPAVLNGLNIFSVLAPGVVTVRACAHARYEAGPEIILEKIIYAMSFPSHRIFLPKIKL
jgi:hypothetical protein